MHEIKLVDSTLRDGGYINDWMFGETAIKSIIAKLAQTGIELIEVGFIKGDKRNINSTMFGAVEDIAPMIAPKNHNVKYVGMLDMSKPFPLDKIPPYDGTSVDIMRVIFKKTEMHNAYEYCKQIQTKGYGLFVQVVGTDNYTDKEFVDCIELFNVIKPDSFYIVDSFGLIKKKQFLRLAYLADHNLLSEIPLGYHSHNNLQQAASNAEAMLEMNMQRDIYIDACVFGMGRGAGNLNLELFAEFMNENFGRHYRIEPMLEIIDEYLNDIYRENFWGYTVPYYLSATNGCHPNYAVYLAQKGTLTVKSFNELLKSIPADLKANYSKENAERVYLSYQENFVDDKVTLQTLKEELMHRPVLVLAPGQSVHEHADELQKFIDDKSARVICVNYMDKRLPVHYVFSSNFRRYKDLEFAENVKKIITSNVKDAHIYDYLVNFSSYVTGDPEIVDNSGLMLLHLLSAIGLSKVYVAGMDGYSVDNSKNYINSGLEYNFGENRINQRNKLITEELRKINKILSLVFLTETCYHYQQGV